MRRRGAIAAILAFAAILISGCSAASAINSIVATGAVNCTGGDIGTWTNGRTDVARRIVEAGLANGVGEAGAKIGVAVGITESGLRAIDYGDMMGPIQADGTRGMSSSRGPFQQMTPWGPLEDRIDPYKSAVMFFTGGQIVPSIPNDGKETGLKDVPGWENMPPQQAAQAVQRSEFTDGSNFATNMAAAGELVKAIMVNCQSPGAGGANVANGPDVTIPNNPNVVEQLRGKVIRTPSAAVAKGIAAGFDQLGLPYVWGGGGSGAGPNDGCVRGGGDLNSCQGLTGFDCSGLTAYVLGQAGYQIPGDSGSQRGSGTSVPKDQALPGDIYGFPGHVSISLGIIDGQAYHLEASTPGTAIHIVAMNRSDVDSNVHRYWSAAGTA